jgi:hypothetical protein
VDTRAAYDWLAVHAPHLLRKRRLPPGMTADAVPVAWSAAAVLQYRSFHRGMRRWLSQKSTRPGAFREHSARTAEALAALRGYDN